MRSPRGRDRRRLARLALAALISFPGLVAALPSSATPTEAQLEAAQGKLDALREQESLLVEQYDQAQLALRDAQAKLRDAQRDLARAQAEAEHARAALDKRAVAAYTGMGSELGVLLGAQSFSDFSDSVEFLDQIAERDSDLALEAERAGQQARWAGQRLADAVKERQQALETIDRKTGQIKDTIAQQEDLVAELHQDVVEERKAAQQAALAPPPVGNIGGDGPPPPAPSPRAQEAIDAAWSVIGVPYQWGGSNPETGFDCSGLTMWAWAHAGVSLPHGSAAQYSVLPHVPQDQLQPGDLVFFYSPIHHVGLYIGGGKMIDAPHTGTVVQVRPVEWSVYVGAGRPG